MNQIIGRLLFTDGLPRDVYCDSRGQYVIDSNGRRVYGLWIVMDESEEDAALVFANAN